MRHYTHDDYFHNSHRGIGGSESINIYLLVPYWNGQVIILSHGIQWKVRMLCKQALVLLATVYLVQSQRKQLVTRHQETSVCSHFLPWSHSTHRSLSHKSWRELRLSPCWNAMLALKMMVVKTSNMVEMLGRLNRVKKVTNLRVLGSVWFFILL